MSHGSEFHVQVHYQHKITDLIWPLQFLNEEDETNSPGIWSMGITVGSTRYRLSGNFRKKNANSQN